MPSGDARSIGYRAENAAAEKYGYELENDEPDHDLRNPANGYVYEVKACRTERGNGSPGRLRLWEQEHEALSEQRGAYIFAIYDGDSGNIWKIEKVSTGDVEAAVAGRWYGSGHADKARDGKGRQYKLSWRDIL